ncbi:MULTISPECIES: 50S ribosomal protein L23 [Paenibacillus]|uniref:50S ribosomal protein L23 n=1 Tax=Paenibacillus TaxID=44249 RepID=UPI00020D7FD3|nr:MULTISPECIES: 50S ribosomal protein L23 [Paenibacillus]EGL14485.1 ribosomal protein L23 [Paenibacillus sp. HGF7]EPD88536.1 50S ribosomal protein L23 [Paenibacillus sp. HGH0039]MBV6717524.1 50S ribosomal protein L23 [Paenibacillus chitinolyticus]MEC0247187.1 50S ribosomal protein L23 [Paenibacillus chitinolyticus]GKS14435.1 50S ribosomal protein L23 [Paenibacillus chitinolyticus]
MKNPRDIIKRPVITERSTEMMADKKYVFEVEIRANKTEIKQAIEQIFKVKVSSVNTLRMPAKPKRQGRHSGYTSEWKKAIVTLSADSKELEFFETV